VNESSPRNVPACRKKVWTTFAHKLSHEMHVEKGSAVVNYMMRQLEDSRINLSHETALPRQTAVCFIRVSSIINTQEPSSSRTIQLNNVCDTTRLRSNQTNKTTATAK